MRLPDEVCLVDAFLVVLSKMVCIFLISSSENDLTNSLCEIKNFLKTRYLIVGLGLEQNAIEMILAKQKIYHTILRNIIKSKLN